MQSKGSGCGRWVTVLSDETRDHPTFFVLNRIKLCFYLFFQPYFLSIVIINHGVVYCKTPPRWDEAQVNLSNLLGCLSTFGLTATLLKQRVKKKEDIILLSILKHQVCLRTESEVNKYSVA